jgi:hypothetical protein
MMLLVMLGVAVVFFRGQSAFGLFKLAMYIQPFLLGSLALAWARLSPGRCKWLGFAGIAALVPMQISTQYSYVSYSATAAHAGGDNPGASREHLFAQYHQALQTPGAKRFVVPVNEHFSRLLVGCCSRGVTIYIPAYAPKLLTRPFELEEPYRAPPSELLVVRRRNNRDCDTSYPSTWSLVSIPLQDPINPKAICKVESDTPVWVDRPQKGDYLLQPPERFELFNRARRSHADRNCRVVPLTDVNNYL